MAKSLIGKIFNAAASRPIPFASSYNVRGGMLYGSGPQDRFTELQSMGAVGTLFAIVQLLSQGAAGPDWHMYRKPVDGRVRYSSTDSGSDMRQEVLQHQALNLWQSPNDFMTGFDFRECGWQFMELVGEWYWVLDRGPSGLGVPLEMWPVRPDRMEPVPDRDNFLKGWVYTGPNGETVPLDHEEVIQLKYPDPSDFYRGMSAVQSLLADIDASKYTAEWSRNFFLNSATPGGIVQFSKRLSDDEFDEFTLRWREQHQGVARGHRVGVLEQGAIWIPNTYSMRDMQFNELRKMSREIIREAYRVHSSMIGLSEDVNRANAQTAEEVHVAWHEVKRCVRVRNVLNNRFLPMFGTTGKAVEFDFDDPTPRNPTEDNAELTTKANAAAVLVKAGFMPDDVCNVVGLPKMKTAPVPAPAPRPALPPGTPGAKPGEQPPAKPGAEPIQPSEAAVAAMIRDVFREMGATDREIDEYSRIGEMLRAQLPGHKNGKVKELR